jgi:peptide/nickel transport system permease protein
MVGNQQLFQRAHALLGRHAFMRFLLGRLIALVLLLWGITLIAFTLTHLVPSDPVLANLGILQVSDPTIVHFYREKYGLDKPLPEQYEIYLGNLIKGDLGVSEQSRRPVLTDLEEFVPATVELAVSTILLAVAAGVALGTVAGTHPGQPVDHLLRVLSLVSTSTPVFWLGLVGLYVLYFRLGWLPGTGRLDPGIDGPPHVTGLYTVDSLVAGNIGLFINALQHLVLPASVLAIPQIGLLTRLTRASVLDAAQEEYINVARAKGLSRLSVVRHIMRAALPPVVTVIGFLFAEVMTGTVLVEIIFAWPGMGRYAFQSATTLDLPSIMGVTLFVALVYIIVNFAIDILYGVIDPRLRIS